MGIVMAVCMLLGALALAPPGSSLGRWAGRAGTPRAQALVLLAAGTWNALWHGLRHLHQFWGQAALVSGLLMMVAAGLIGSGVLNPGHSSAAPATRILSLTACLGLWLCFVVYASALVRLNLGYPVWGQ